MYLIECIFLITKSKALCGPICVASITDIPDDKPDKLCQMHLIIKHDDESYLRENRRILSFISFAKAHNLRNFPISAF